MSKHVNGDGTLPKPNFHDIYVRQLAFDTENPRLTMELEVTNDTDMVTWLWRSMAVDEIVDSIYANGFFREEPLIVIPKIYARRDPEKDTFIVVEGNRRLAAVRLLLDKELRRKAGATDIPEIDDSLRKELEKLPVAVYQKREHVWSYLGFRHINGPKPWDALGKAQFVAKIYEKQGLSLDQIAQQIGDRNATVKRLYRGFTLLRQAESQAGFERADAVRARFYFSHLYTAADQTEFQKFLGISAESSLKKNPVSPRKRKELAELMLWIYGSRNQQKEPIVQTQFPDLNILRTVISTASGIRALRAGYGLARAHEISIGDAERFREAMTQARENLVQANGTVVNGYRGESDLATVSEDVVKLAQNVATEVGKKYSPKLVR